MRHGHEAQKLAPSPDTPPAPAPPPQVPLSEGAWIAQRLGSPQLVWMRRSRADVKALLDAPASSSPEALSRLALQRRLHLSGKAASSFEAEIEREEAARLALEEADTGLQGTQSINQSSCGGRGSIDVRRCDVLAP